MRVLARQSKFGSNNLFDTFERDLSANGGGEKKRKKKTHVIRVDDAQQSHTFRKSSYYRCYIIGHYRSVGRYSQCTFSCHRSSMPASGSFGFSARHTRNFPSSSTVGVNCSRLTPSCNYQENHRLFVFDATIDLHTGPSTRTRASRRVRPSVRSFVSYREYVHER